MEAIGHIRRRPQCVFFSRVLLSQNSGGVASTLTVSFKLCRRVKKEGN